MTKLLEPLGDPATRVGGAAPISEVMDSKDPLPSFRTTGDGILIVTIRNPMAFDKAGEDLKKMREPLAAAKAVIFDLRGSIMGGYLLDSSGIQRLLSASPVRMPRFRQRVHSGYASPDSSGSGGYYSAWVVTDAADVVSAPGGRDVHSVFLVDSKTTMPAVAFGLQFAGKAAIVSEGRSADVSADSGSQLLRDSDGVQVTVRFQEMVMPDGSRPAADRTFPGEAAISERSPAFKAALEMARSANWARPETKPLVEESALPEKRYTDEPYPSRELRQLAAIKIWAVFEYFFPYKHLTGEDWNQVLIDYLPRLEDASGAEQYVTAVAEMLTHTHDSHVNAGSRILYQELYGTPTAADLRWIESQPVVVGLKEKVEGLEVGDVIRKIDGKPCTERIEKLKRIIPASTPQALMARGAGQLLNGIEAPAWRWKPKAATATWRPLSSNVHPPTGRCTHSRGRPSSSCRTTSGM